MRRVLLTALASLALPGTAFAGGFGLITNAGFHQARAYYYNDEGDQGVDVQQRFNYGVGGLAVLGDKDDRVQGVMRLYFLGDQPLADPNTGDTADAIYPAESEQPWKKYGVMTAGIQWGLFGDPTALQLTLETHVGSGFANAEGLEFLLADVGPGVTWNLVDNLQAFGSATATMRFRKRFYLSENVYLGVRYMFD